MRISVFHRNFSGSHKLGERPIHINHSLVKSGFNHRIYFVCSSFTDKIRHGVVVYEKFVRRNKPAGNARYEPLRKDSGEALGKLGADLALLVGGEGDERAPAGPGEAWPCRG